MAGDGAAADDEEIAIVVGGVSTAIYVHIFMGPIDAASVDLMLVALKTQRSRRMRSVDAVPPQPHLIVVLRTDRDVTGVAATKAGFYELLNSKTQADRIDALCASVDFIFMPEITGPTRAQINNGEFEQVSAKESTKDFHYLVSFLYCIDSL